MITIEEPQRREYTEEESRLIKHKFITLLYILLIVYLTLHQFLIPLVSNLFKGRHFATDIHWFFMIHFYGYYQLKKKLEMSRGFYAFLWLITILQIIFGVLTMGKWGLFSLALTQVSTLLFLYFVVPFVSNTYQVKSIVSHLLVGGIVFAGLQVIEIKSSESLRVTERKIVMHHEDFNISFPGTFPLKNELSVWSLGNQGLHFKDYFKIVNDKDVVIDIRLYELKIKSERVRWKYKRLAQLKAHESWDLPLENDTIYLVKSPERKDLEVLILIPQNYKFPLGSGRLSVGFNSLEWRGITHE